MAVSLPAPGAPVSIRVAAVPRLRSVDDPLAVSQRWWDEIWRDGNLDAIDELFTEPLTRHTGSGSESVSRAAYKGRLAEAQRILVAGADDDRRPRRRRRHGLDPGHQHGHQPRDRRALVVTWLIVQRVVDGRIAEQWVATFPGVDWTA